MENAVIDITQAKEIDGISQRCGEVTVGCSDVAGVVTKVITSFEALRREHAELEGTVRELDRDQQLSLIHI